MERDVLARLDARIAALKDRLRKLSALRETLTDETLSAEFEQLFSMNASQVHVERGGSAVYNAIADFFEENGNNWATIKEIVAGVSGPYAKESIRQILYRARPNSFERLRKSGPTRETKFRLRNAVRSMDSGG